VRPFVAALAASLPLVALAEERFIEGEASGRGLPWLWILLAVGLLLGLVVAWVAWGRRIPPPGQPWR
jgi:hypothetical protein